MNISAKFSIGQEVFVMDTKTGEAYERCFIQSIENITVMSNGTIKYNAIYGSGGGYGYFDECDAFATKEEARTELDKYDGTKTVASWVYDRTAIR